MHRNLEIEFKVFSISDIKIQTNKESKLSQGSFGQTFLGTLKDKSGNDIPCVVKQYKTYHKKNLLDEDIIKEIIFLRLLNQFGVNGVVKLFGVLLHDNKFYLVLEKLDKTLEDVRLKEKQEFDPLKTKHIFHGLLSAIDSMHSLGILHNDTKLANIMLKGDDIKLIDFGLSKFIGIAPLANQVVRSYNTTPVIMAPDEKRISYSTDVFSIGRTMFHFFIQKYNTVNYNDKESVYDWTQRKKFTKYEIDTFFGSNGGELLANMLNNDVYQRYCANTALDDKYFKDLPTQSGGILNRIVFGDAKNVEAKNIEYCYFEKIYENYKNDPLTLKGIDINGDKYYENVNDLLNYFSKDTAFNFEGIDSLLNGIILTNQHFDTYMGYTKPCYNSFLYFNVVLYQLITSNYSHTYDRLNRITCFDPYFNINLNEILKFDINFYPISVQINFIYVHLLTNVSTEDSNKKFKDTFYNTFLLYVIFWFIQTSVLSSVNKINDVIIYCAIKALHKFKIDSTKFAILKMDKFIYQRMNDFMIDNVIKIDFKKYSGYAKICLNDDFRFPIDELKSKAELKKLIELGYSINELLDNGFTIPDLFANGIFLWEIPTNLFINITDFEGFRKYTKKEFDRAKLMPSQLIKMGASLKDLIDAGFNINDFNNLIDTSAENMDPEKPFKIDDLKKFYNVDKLTKIFTLKKLLSSGYDLRSIKDEYRLHDLVKSSEFELTNLKQFFQLSDLYKYFDPTQLYEAGFDVKQIRRYFLLENLTKYFSINVLKNEAGIEANEFYDLPISKLKEAYTLKELVKAKKPLQLLIQNYPIDDLKKFFDLQDFLTIGTKIIELKKFFSLNDFVGLKVQPSVLLSAGYEVSDLKDFFKPGQLLDAGVALTTLKDLYPLIDLKRDDISATSLQLAGVEYDKLKNAYSLGELIKENISLMDLLNEYKFTILQLKTAGITLEQFQSMDIPLSQLKGIFNLNELLRAKFPLSDFQGVYTLSELKSAGVKADELLSAGFELNQFYKFYNLSELVISKIPLSNLRELGFTATDLKKLGVAVDKLIGAGYTVSDLSDAKFSARDLFLAEIKLIDIFKTGNYNYGDIKDIYHQQSDPQLELLIKQCSKTMFTRKTNPECKYDRITDKVINPPASKKGGRRYVYKSRRINRKK